MTESPSSGATLTPILDLVQPLASAGRRRLKAVLIGLFGGLVFAALLIAGEAYPWPTLFGPVAAWIATIDSAIDVGE